MSENPYSEPQSDVAAPSLEGALSIEAPRGRPIGHGWRWLSQAWQLFTPTWGIWILTLLLMLVIMFLIQIVPFIGPIAGSLLGPVFGAGVLSMAHKARGGEGIEVGDLFAGFRERTGPLVGLGAINLLVTFVVIGGMMALMVGSMGAGMENMAANGEPDMEAMMSAQGGAMIYMLLMFALLIPWFAAYWFAVPLVFFGEYGIGSALKTSLVACLKNILPMLWYSIIVLVLATVASIPLLLGWLVLMPVMVIAYYTMFRDIFTADS